MAEQTIRTDDLTGEAGAEPFEFGLDGTDYTIDLTPQNRADLQERLAGYVEVATVKPKGRDKDKDRNRRPRRDGGGSGQQNRQLTEEIRQWAREQGFDVKDRGRLPNDVTEAFYAANPDKRPAAVEQTEPDAA